MRSLLISIALVLASAQASVAAGLPGDLGVAQNTGAADRGAAGSGSMGIGQGIEYLDGDDRERGDPPRREPDRTPAGTAGEPGHGGNETDMEHRKRPTLQRRSD